MATDPTSLEALLGERRWLRRLAGALVRDAADADDLAQEAWVTALTRRPREVRHPRAWLATVVRNLARDRNRRDARRTRREEDRPAPRPIPRPDELVEKAEVAERVGRAVLALDAPYREVLLLRYFEDLPPRDIAAHLGVPVETVRTRIKRALALLACRLDREHGGDRRGWALPLLLWAEPAPGAPALPLLGSTLLGGMLAMKKTLLVLALAIAVFLVVGPWMPSSDPAAPIERPPSGGEPAAEAAAGPAATTTLRGRAPEAPAEEGPHMTWALVGTVTYPGRVPAPGVRVRLYTGTDALAPDDVARTDGAGRFRLRPRAPLDEGLAMFRLVAEDGSGRVASRERWNVEVPRTEDADAGRLLLEPGFPLALRVETQGRPVPDARVTIRHGGFQRQALVAERVTGPDGLVRVEGLLPYLYRLRVDAAGLPSLYALVSLPQDEGDVYRIDLPPPRTVEVEVVEAPAMRPLAGVRVQVLQRLAWGNTSQHQPLPGADAIAPTDARGRTRIEGLGRSPDLRLGVWARGHAHLGYVHATDSWSVQHEAPIPIPPDADTMRVVVPAGRRVTWPLVRGDAPIPPDGTVVRLDGTTTTSRPYGVEEGVVEGGRLVIEGLVEGVFTARGQTPAGLVARIVAPAGAVEGEPLAFWWPRTLEVVLRREDGTPVPGAAVLLEAASGPQIQTPFAHTDEEGVARWTGLPALRGRVRTTGSAPTAQPVDLEAGDQQVEITVAMPEVAGRHEVAIRPLVDGQPTLPDTYRLQPAEHGVQVSLEGEVEADGVLRARWWPRSDGDAGRLRLVAEGFQPATFEVREGDGVVDVPLARGCAVRLRVLSDATGWRDRPRYHAERQDERSRTWEVCTLPGATRPGESRVPLNPPLRGVENRYEGLAPGRYRFVEDRLGRITEPVVLQPGEAAPIVTLDARAGERVTGRVVLPAGHGVEEAVVTWQEAGAEGRVPVEASGDFAFPWPQGARSIELVVHHPVLGPHPERGRVRLDAPREGLLLELVRGPVAEIALRVEERDGGRLRPGQHVPVHLRDLEHAERPPIVLPARLEAGAGDGEWALVFAGNEPGTWSIWADVGHHLAPLRIDRAGLDALDPTLGPIPLGRGSSVHIRVETADGQPPPLLVARATYEDRPHHERHAAVVSEHEVVLHGLEAGRYRVRAGPVDPVADAPPTALDEVIEVDGIADHQRVIHVR